jgi:translocation and assembly module TamB
VRRRAGLPLPRAARRASTVFGEDRRRAAPKGRAPASWGNPKRLAKRIRANVTSGVAESREIRFNVEWQLSPRVSVEGSYDNVNDISSSSLGNLGADVPWRMEFE